MRPGRRDIPAQPMPNPALQIGNAFAHQRSFTDTKKPIDVTQKFSNPSKTVSSEAETHTGETFAPKNSKQGNTPLPSFELSHPESPQTAKHKWKKPQPVRQGTTSSRQCQQRLALRSLSTERLALHKTVSMAHSNKVYLPSTLHNSSSESNSSSHHHATSSPPAPPSPERTKVRLRSCSLLAKISRLSLQTMYQSLNIPEPNLPTATTGIASTPYLTILPLTLYRALPNFLHVQPGRQNGHQAFFKSFFRRQERLGRGFKSYEDCSRFVEDYIRHYRENLKPAYELARSEESDVGYEAKANQARLLGSFWIDVLELLGSLEQIVLKVRDMRDRVEPGWEEWTEDDERGQWLVEAQLAMLMGSLKRGLMENELRFRSIAARF
ncbi:hypothetical protein BJ508DRAFT_332820 [Ascobolus immersus RN42]|uniref:Uncharacterized protein n=1 Tax=Ascobolus immersus RN42 TaxID=1160509 RepID=A0A3N4HYB4_ASCIM|nr:hypothetical protein BJ508DRAFT_332820 [Ascobolus immersus RN42]